MHDYPSNTPELCTLFSFARPQAVNCHHILNDEGGFANKFVILTENSDHKLSSHFCRLKSLAALFKELLIGLLSVAKWRLKIPLKKLSSSSFSHDFSSSVQSSGRQSWNTKLPKKRVTSDCVYCVFPHSLITFGELMKKSHRGIVVDSLLCSAGNHGKPGSR